MTFNRLFRATAFVVRFAKNLFWKVKGEIQNFNYVDASEIYEAKIHKVKARRFYLTGCVTNSIH